jgi:TolB-like protein/DNA-binding winged helix-turn-helix (wHTH) protein/lipopolysaccharide biosynthesis regulator YciM
VRFGAFEFDPSSGDLWKAGRRIRLQNQPRQILRILVARHGELVTREELRRELWPDDTFVDFDNGLNVAIRKVRDAVGDLAPSPRFIETERAQGYRFIAPVIEPSAQPDETNAWPQAASEGMMSDSHSVSSTRPNEAKAPVNADDGEGDVPSLEKRPTRHHVLVTAVLLLVLASWSLWVWQARDRRSPPLTDRDWPLSLAVLPLTSGSDHTEELLSAGIADSIITRLSNVSQFRVRPTTAVAQYRGREIDAQEIGRRLQSEYVLVGTIRTTADRVRASVQLVATPTGVPVWGNQYDVERGNLLHVEDTIADEIAAALRVEISDAERERLERRYTRSGAAYERYLMGRARLRSVAEEDARQAIVEFEAASELDPGFAPAYAGLATAAAQLRVRFASAREAEIWDTRARQEAGRALQLDPDLAEAHVALAAVHRFQEYDWNTVIRESRRAIELNPSLDLPHLYLAVAYFHIGLLDEAESSLEAARRLNPEIRAEPLEIAGAVHLFAGRTAEAIRSLSQADSLTDSRITRYLLAWALYYHGERQRAEAMLETMVNDEGPVPGNARATLAALLARRGATAEARALAERVMSERDLIHHGAYGLATAYAQLGDPTTALRWLSEAAATGFACYPWYQRDPLLDPIRTDSGFTAFMGELRRSWEDTRAKYAGGRNASAPLHHK